MSNKNNLFITLLETRKIEKVVTKLDIGVTDFNIKLRTYLSYQSEKFLNIYYPSYKIKEYEIYTFPYLPRWYFMILFTIPNTNHPFLIMTHLDHKQIWIIKPIGKDYGQVDIQDVKHIILDLNKIESFGLFFLLEKTIYIRKYAILKTKQFSLLDCSNISNCIKKMHEINKLKISKEKKQELIFKYNDYYLNKAVDFLQLYFTMLETNNFEEAYLFLKGDQGKYYKKERLNTFFKDTKTIIGHLQIFIPLYELLNDLRTKLI
jgi:hypothetical protein